VIRCEGVSFGYPDGTRALDGIDLSIEAGERVAIAGPNGSGKSTLVRLWNGLLRPTAGRVLVDGRSTEGRHVADLARTVALVFQDPTRQLFQRTCRAEVAFGARNAGLRGRALDVAVDAALDAVGLADDAATTPYDLGASRRRLLAIAGVVAMATPVVVLDEPTIGLDTRERGLVAGRVARLATEGGTVVAISHDARFVAESFGRLIRLGAGRVVADGRPAEAVGAG
jgi:energy-coupling factor transport system ATP-binding protein